MLKTNIELKPKVEAFLNEEIKIELQYLIKSFEAFDLRQQLILVLDSEKVLPLAHVIGNIVPGLVTKMYEHFQNGELEKAWEINDAILPLCEIFDKIV
jgi:hypothetical protein